MEKYVDIVKKDGTKVKMELLMAFRLEEENKDCIFYKDQSTNKVYAAAYDKKNNEVVLNAKFTDEEKTKLQNIYKEIFLGGKQNA